MDYRDTPQTNVHVQCEYLKRTESYMYLQSDVANLGCMSKTILTSEAIWQVCAFCVYMYLAIGVYTSACTCL